MTFDDNTGEKGGLNLQYPTEQSAKWLDTSSFVVELCSPGVMFVESVES
jgi:hypothetical protein